MRIDEDAQKMEDGLVDAILEVLIDGKLEVLIDGK